MLSEKIVVIDDDPKVIKSIKMILTGYEILDFQQAQQALDYLRQPHVINLVIVDVMMPGVDGLMALEEIKRIDQKIAVIMMSAYATKDIAIQALQAHADDFIEKPFSREELQEKVRRLLREKLPKKQTSQAAERIERIKRFVNRNCQNATLEFIAREMCLSPKYISRIFNKKSGISFREYKLNVQMEKAKSLLQEADLNVNEISLELGYQNAESFMRIFKRLNKMTPSQYREQVKK